MNNAAKKIGRRHFLKLLAGAYAYATLGSPGLAGAQTTRYGKLADTTRCIGCKRCMSACKRWNKLEVERNELVSDRETDLSSQNWVVVNLRADAKNLTQRIYEHWACQHCIHPACAGVCPVKAITKLPMGNVVINEKKCIGCRYCYQACPYKVPRFDFEKRITRKCHLCYDRIPLLNYMKPACVEACPVEALSFGYKHEIILEAKKRIYKERNARYILGLKEAGGTDMLTILPTQPENLGLIVAPQKMINHNLDKLRITGAGFMGASALAGLMYTYATLTQGKEKKNRDSSD
ncbi:MAG: 4Fe-4S dicluster domain-containing protein [Deltaproteobacteria bacterium]|nr:4Fe-4S dicluster domain-containing protein [Deltaproteobacteria bacterium]MBW1748325.1 4Fe-4S dicluster domain-containing protein [Deltaproteobacteria bacterium]MBW1826627.1 4Fe-4S dicluster domain-containing protein [Deltaproteobacteria bacterium]MBW1963158.1 4Fe-4S dicluster domain-containing protein [Deltaproteobacteria bacterium]MBW1969133.1 4Fe-4S dicluster domain-containing protein [Deltaproteobacteria bacterium]